MPKAKRVVLADPSAAAALLDEYSKKRAFDATPEPAPAPAPGEGLLLFVVQKHSARQLHYDFRLECDGVLKSWAVPRGPSLNPADKRLAVMTEDHPYDYASFEGVIPPKQYGAGTVMRYEEDKVVVLFEEEGMKSFVTQFVIDNELLKKV